MLRRPAGEGGALRYAVCDRVDARLCVCVWGLCVLLGLLEEGEELMERGGVVRIIALQSFLDRPSGALMSQEGFGCSWFPLKTGGNGAMVSGLEGARGGVVVVSYFSLVSFRNHRIPVPPSSTKVFIDYLVPLLNNLILGDSALCSHRN